MKAGLQGLVRGRVRGGWAADQSEASVCVVRDVLGSSGWF